jgi:hypothetical protein
MTLRRDLSMKAEQDQAFRDMFDRGFSDVPGFVAGIWTFDPEASEAVIVLSFASLSDAEAFAKMARRNADRQASLGLELVAVRVSEILGTA